MARRQILINLLWTLLCTACPGVAIATERCQISFQTQGRPTTITRQVVRGQPSLIPSIGPFDFITATSGNCLFTVYNGADFAGRYVVVGTHLTGRIRAGMDGINHGKQGGHDTWRIRALKIEAAPDTDCRLTVGIHGAHMMYFPGRFAHIPAVDRALQFDGKDCHSVLWNKPGFGQGDANGRFSIIHPVNRVASHDIGFRARALEVNRSSFQCPEFTRDNGGRCLPNWTLPTSIYVGPGPPTPRDLDRDGLDDAFENRLAHAFRPIYFNDTNEHASRTQTYRTVDDQPVSEPVTIFEVAPSGTDDIAIRYMRLWRRDISESTFCRGHEGDSQRHAVHIRTTRAQHGRFWWVRRTTIGINGDLSWRQNQGRHHSVHFMPSPDHPRQLPRHLAIHFSQGKHHEYADARWSGQRDL
ncbi:MAG: hypothetical protein VX589_02280, partial [Myxococcota bacterium]|nr:hypothetical protein [Myxococcota bacterium]